MDLKQTTKLGQSTEYPEHYDPKLLTPIPRQANREKLGISGELPFLGEDLWNGYELSWLNPKGKPVAAIGVFRIPADSPNIIESKSFKLYLNSFNQTSYASLEEVQGVMARDLSAAVNADVSVQILPSAQWVDDPNDWEAAECLDGLDITCTTYAPDTGLLQLADDASGSSERVSETLCSHLLKSNCPVTGQPDWATVYIRYEGKRIDHAGLLRYIVSMRGHQDFHEHCVESIYMAIMARCQPERLAVYARYTRRGGLDINPLRSNYSVRADNFKLARQ
ncbi:NADPH-dependent 7-cyano-7-deazaguanine reductase QueF [Hahella ganghwensis]|uniref:NADPH-dependent 7-cyano-7-deazaguanine reductase QueF n=1 Tax=Hahella ganghwensis TaxID=286420 RepID=UPI00035FF52B|nr:NADPH-dependent 7-cyano-7-deazaguanine reductase QueF [Hahella ganghwensis]